MQGSGPIASDNIGQIVQIIDIPSHFPVILQDIFIAFQSLFAIIPGPIGIFAAHQAFSVQWQIWAQVITNAVNIAPNVGRFVFPTDTTASQVVQLSSLQADFAQVLTRVQSNLNRTLVSVMSNVTEFLAFAEQGNFSSDQVPSVPAESNYLYYGFNTYIISQALNGNNVYATLGRHTDVHALVTNESTVNYNIDCHSGYNDQGVCDTFWWSVSDLNSPSFVFGCSKTVSNLSETLANRSRYSQVTNQHSALTTSAR